MSLVATWCKCTDGKWYEEPVWEGKGWFICLDDDDPPELVVQENCKCNGTGWFRIVRKDGEAQRLFNGSWQPARSYFGKFTQVPPPPQRYDSVSDTRPSYMGCFYDFEEWSQEKRK